MYSIRKRLNLTIITGMIMMLSATAIFLYLLIARQIETVFDSAMFDKTQAMISLIELEDDAGIEFDFTEEGMMPEFADIENLQYYQIWENGTEILLKSPSLGDTELPLPGVKLGQHGYADFDLADGRSGRLIEIGFLPRVEKEEVVWEATEIGDDEWEAEDPSEPQPLILSYARERESLDETLLVIGLTIGGVITGMLGLSAFMILRLVGSGLLPLSRLAQQVSQIDESKLDQRVSQDGEQSIEIAPIRNQLNHLLERLHSASEREKRFSSNVAHELRTPLAELKTLAEVCVMVPEDRDQIRGFFTDVSEISQQMETIVTTLLELARSDAGLLRSDPEDINLAAYCDTIWEQAVNGNSFDKRLSRNIPAGLVINTDREKLGMILTNLFVNAVSYSPEDAEIEINAAIRNEMVVLEVKNAANDLKPEDIVHMRDRFWRKQKTPDRFGHSGLGLSLVDTLARIMRLNIDLQLEQQVFMVSISGIRPSMTN